MTRPGKFVRIVEPTSASEKYLHRVEPALDSRQRHVSPLVPPKRPYCLKAISARVFGSPVLPKGCRHPESEVEPVGKEEPARHATNHVMRMIWVGVRVRVLDAQLTVD